MHAVAEARPRASRRPPGRDRGLPRRERSREPRETRIAICAQCLDGSRRRPRLRLLHLRNALVPQRRHAGSGYRGSRAFARGGAHWRNRIDAQTTTESQTRARSNEWSGKTLLGSRHRWTPRRRAARWQPLVSQRARASNRRFRDRDQQASWRRWRRGGGDLAATVLSTWQPIRQRVSNVNLSPMLSRQGHRLLQVGIALLIFSSIEGFAIPYLPSPPLGLSVHRLSALQAVLLMALGLLWPRLDLAEMKSRCAFWLLLYSTFSTRPCRWRQERLTEAICRKLSSNSRPILQRRPVSDLSR